MSTRQRVILFVLFIIMLFSISAAAYEENVLRVGAAAWMHTKFPLEEAARRFEENHPGVEVKLMQTQEFDASVIMKMRRGETNYDILCPFEGGHMIKFVELGLLEPLDDLFDNPKYIVDGKMLQQEDFLQGYMDLMMHDGKLYSLPIFGEVAMLAYRKDYWEEAGIETPPETWEELRNYAKILTTDDVAGFTAILGRGSNALLTLFSMVKGMGGKVLDEKGNYNFLDPITKKAMTLLVEMYRKDKSIQQDAAQTFNAPRDGFKAGTVAMANFWHSWALESADVFGQEKLGLVPLPGTLENGTMIYAGGAIIPNMGNVELAKKFIVEMFEAKWFQQWSANHYYKAPVRRQNLEGLEGDYWLDMVELVDNGSVQPSFLDGPKMNDTFAKYLVEALTGNISPVEALERAYKEVSQMRK